METTTLFLSPIIDLITVNGIQYDLIDYMHLTGFTRQELIDLVPSENITYSDYEYGPLLDF